MKIPTNKGVLNYIDYTPTNPDKFRCYIIEIDHDSEEDHAYYQYNGIMCKSAYVKGTLVATIENSFKWFNPKWWYSLYHSGDTVKMDNILNKNGNCPM